MKKAITKKEDVSVEEAPVVELEEKKEPVELSALEKVKARRENVTR